MTHPQRVLCKIEWFFPRFLPGAARIEIGEDHHLHISSAWSGIGVSQVALVDRQRVLCRKGRRRITSADLCFGGGGGIGVETGMIDAIACVGCWVSTCSARTPSRCLVELEGFEFWRAAVIYLCKGLEH